MDTSGKVCSVKLNSIPSFRSTLCFGNPAFKDSHSLYYWNHYNDTIFQITKDSTKCRYLFAKGDFRLKPQYYNIVESKPPPFLPKRFVQTHKYLFFNYFYGGEGYTTFLDKSSGDFLRVNTINDVQKKREDPGITNDIDGGLGFLPFISFNENGDTYLGAWCFAYQLKAHIASDAFKNSNPKYPEKKKALVKLANNLNENDNPVLMVIKLK
jgi:hypothetical protein